MRTFRTDYTDGPLEKSERVLVLTTRGYVGHQFPNHGMKHDTVIGLCTGSNTLLEFIGEIASLASIHETTRLLCPLFRITFFSGALDKYESRRRATQNVEQNNSRRSYPIALCCWNKQLQHNINGPVNDVVHCN